jgi:hypothetical protein
VVDEQPMLQVLAGVGEADAVQLGVAARAGVMDRRGEPDQRAAEGDREVREARVPANGGLMVGDLHGVARPVGQRHHDQVAAVADVNLDVVGVGGRAPLVDDDGGAPIGLHVDDQVAGGRDGRIGAGDADVGRSRRRRVLRDRDDRGLGDRSVRTGADPVRG